MHKEHDDAYYKECAEMNKKGIILAEPRLDFYWKTKAWRKMLVNFRVADVLLTDGGMDEEPELVDKMATMKMIRWAFYSSWKMRTGILSRPLEFMVKQGCRRRECDFSTFYHLSFVLVFVILFHWIWSKSTYHNLWTDPLAWTYDCNA